MEACTLPVPVSDGLLDCINKSEFLGYNLSPVVVLTDIMDIGKSVKKTRLETPPGSEEGETQYTECISVKEEECEEKTSFEMPKIRISVSSKSDANEKRLKSVKRKRDSWDPTVEYEVEEIVGHCRTDKNNILYEVKWKYWPSVYNTFEPLENLTGCNYELMRYFERRAPTTKDIMRQHLRLEAGLSKRKLYKKMKSENCGAEVLEIFAQLCPGAGELFSHKDLEELQDLVQEEYGYIVRCLIGMGRERDPGLVFRGQNYKLLLKVIQIRRKQMEKNAFHENLINSRESTKITIENQIDLEEFPRIKYIVEPKPGAGIVLAKDPLLGCECPDGCNPKSRCCGAMADSLFAYTHNGKLRTNKRIAIYECNSRCLCPPSCSNRVVQRGRQVKLCIFKTRLCGWGVKAMEQISKGTFVCEYLGEIISESEANYRDRKYCAENRQSRYQFNLDFFADASLPMYCIDATKQGNVARFINHSCDPNLVVYPVWVDGLNPNLHRLAFFAKRNIQRGEEIHFDYQNVGDLETENEEVCSLKGGLQCQCGAANCRKWIFRNS